MKSATAVRAFVLLWASLALAPMATAAPYSDSELRAVESGDEGKLRDLRSQEITQLRIALGRRLPANRQADLYLRLAEIYLESYRADYLLEGKVFDRRARGGSKEKAIDHSHSRPHLVNAIKACREILGFRIPFPKMDQVYYFLGYNYGELGDAKESVKYYDLLTRQYPFSPFAADAWREMGEASFQAGNYRAAATQFETAVKRANADALPRVLHKLAWSYYRVKRFDSAVETMKEAIAAAQKSGEKFISIKEEALRDMAVFMTESGRVEEAIAYFQSVAGDTAYYGRALERLGKQYERTGDVPRAIQVYEAMLKTSPEGEASFRALVKLVDLDLRRGQFRAAFNRLQKAEIPRLNGSREDELQIQGQNLRAMVRRTATEHHEKYRKQKARAALEISDSFYGLYLNKFLSQDDPRGEKPEIQMYLAEVKRELGHSKEASELYRRVVDSGDKRYAKEAGALWTASLSEAIRRQEGRRKTDEPSDLEKEFIAAADSLQDALGDTPEGREAALKAAEVLAGYRATQKDAIKRARKLIARAPRTAQAVTAARLWLQLIGDRLPPLSASPAQMTSDQSDAIEDLKDAMKELRQSAPLLAADQEVGKGKLRAQMADYENRFKILSIAASEKDKDFEAAAKGYEAFAKESGNQEIAEKSYANAIASYVRTGDDPSVDRVSAAWLKRFPHSPKALESLRAAATHALIVGRFDAAARIFERLGTEGGDADALETAARIYDGNGDLAKAAGAWGAYVMTHRSSKHYPSAVLALARLYDAANRESDAAKMYQLCMSRNDELSAECGTRLADLELRMKDAARARTNYQKVAASLKKKGAAASPFVGYARYMLASIQEGEAHFSPLKLPEKTLQAAMNQRVAYLEKLSRAYLAAADAGGPWAVAALNRLAAWALHFAEEVDAIEAPAGANPAALAQFKKQLAGVSGPIRRKAVETWMESYQKAVQAELLSPVLPEIADQLASQRVPGFGRAQGPRGRFRLAGMPADGGSGGKDSLEKTRERLLKSGQDASAWVDYGNLLWGLGKPGLSRLVYERALSLNAKNPAALNNRAVVLLSGGEEDWLLAIEGAELLRRALKQDEFFIPAKVNLASLLNYYRVFRSAKPLWDQVGVKTQGTDVYDGQGVAAQGLGRAADAEGLFRKGSDAGGSSSRFAYVFHDAARVLAAGAAGAGEKCVSKLSDLETGSLQGFEKEAVDRLRKACAAWK